MGRRSISCLAFIAAGVTALTGTVAWPQVAIFDRNVIVLDPAHGGADNGGRIASQMGEQLWEKEVTLAMAARLRSLLAADGFNVVLTRAGDRDGHSLEERAELANRSHAVACLVLHATGGSNGVLLGISALGTALMRTPRGPQERSPSGLPALPWGRAQDAYVAQSGRLANQAGTALARSKIATVMMRVVMRPLDNLTCPAISVEVGFATEVRLGVAVDDAYEQRVMESIADALVVWRSQAQPALSVHSSREDGL